MRPIKSNSKRHGSLLLTDNCISDPWAGPILNASLNNRGSTYCQNFMKGYVVTIQEVVHWHIGPIPKGTIGQPCRQMPPPMLENVIAASDRFLYQNSRPKS